MNTIHCFSQCNSSYFSLVDKNNVLKEIKGLNAIKAVQDNNIPVKVLGKKCKLFRWANNSSVQWRHLFIEYAESFKLANITPAFKQGSTNLKDNYGPVSILPIISKIFEKLV